MLCKLISTKKASFKSLSIDKSFDGISFLNYKRIPPPLQLRSRWWGLLKPLMKNWLVGKHSSSFASEIIRISILSLNWCVSNSNLFLSELIFNCPIISLFRFLTLRDGLQIRSACRFGHSKEKKWIFMHFYIIRNIPNTKNIY